MNKKVIVVIAVTFLYANIVLSAVTMVKNKAELSSILAQNRPTVIYFSTSVCGPCNLITPLYEQLSVDTAFSDVHFLKLIMDRMPDGNSFPVKSVPTFKFATNGTINESMTFSGYSDQVVQRIKDKIAMLRGSVSAPAAKPMVEPVSMQQRPAQPSVPMAPPAQSTQAPTAASTNVIAPQPVIKQPLQAHPLSQQKTISSTPSKAVLEKTITHHDPMTQPVAPTMPQPMKMQPDVQPSKLTPVTCPSNGVRGSKIRAMRRQVRRPRQRMKTYNR